MAGCMRQRMKYMPKLSRIKSH
jgi:hypothetical protein